jgi:hypothetical protein
MEIHRRNAITLFGVSQVFFAADTNCNGRLSGSIRTASPQVNAQSVGPISSLCCPFESARSRAETSESGHWALRAGCAFACLLFTARFSLGDRRREVGRRPAPVRGLPRTSLPCRIYSREEARLGKRRVVAGSSQCACESTGPPRREEPSCR